VIGFFKLLAATLLLIGIALPVVVEPAAIAMFLLMVGAFVMHLKVKAPIHKSLPAVSLLVNIAQPKAVFCFLTTNLTALMAF